MSLLLSRLFNNHQSSTSNQIRGTMVIALTGKTINYIYSLGLLIAYDPNIGAFQYVLRMGAGDTTILGADSISLWKIL